MVLVTGGAFAGKLEYCQREFHIPGSEIADGADCKIEDLTSKPLVNHFHLLIRRMTENGMNITDITNKIELVLEKNPDIIIIADELGCGIVPMEKKNRIYREMTGRVCCVLAKEAKTVHRVTCGIGMIIK